MPAHIKFNSNGTKTLKDANGNVSTLSASSAVQLRKKQSVETISLADTTQSTGALATSLKFSDVPQIHPLLLKAIKKEFGFESMTPIQQLTIPTALGEKGKGKDFIAQAATGQGKTLAFLVPSLSCMLENEKNVQGIYILVLAPTRELALQIQQVADKLLKHTEYKAACVIGGNKVSVEQAELANEQVRVLIASPGKCLDHIQRENFDPSHLKYFILDEADRLLDSGFEETLKKIVMQLPKERQTYLFSATMTDKVEDLAHISLKNDIVKLGLDDANSKKVSTLEQKYYEVPNDKKLAALISVLRNNVDKKIIVFVSTKLSVEFVTCVLENTSNIGKVVQLSGNMNQNKRSEIFFQFMEDKNPGVLVATNVAARGLDFPNVDLIVQFDIPEQPADYFHRAGRTARAGKKGVSVLFLTPREKEVALSYFNMMLNNDKEDEKDWEKLEELDNSVTDKQMNDIHREVQSIVSNNQLSRDVFKLVNTYGSVFNMFARKLGFKMNDFDEEGLKSSFGLGGKGGSNFKKSFDKSSSYNKGGSYNNYNNNNNGYNKFNTKEEADNEEDSAETSTNGNGNNNGHHSNGRDSNEDENGGSKKRGLMEFLESKSPKNNGGFRGGRGRGGRGGNSFGGYKGGRNNNWSNNNRSSSSWSSNNNDSSESSVKPAHKKHKKF
ncbi:hypothetical protein C9374_003632 [Naegleria lovaniensis]|uniref:ATP-dependent RNA helicase n=1 Tax=Naegleria lovaniensis TaxID=51637 RepID=A0AA88H3J0_NAELO|nr:uncharacterized protein C9374_003632 [Naegleria lovaniensis]KAG2393868.1 hypothetical protein C9374_003632 [Naegleria lovaniensis]